jgi:hypothetical protein
MKKIARFVYVLYHRYPRLFCVWVAVLALPLLAGAVDIVITLEREDAVAPEPRTWSQIAASDTLRVVTVASSTTASATKNSGVAMNMRWRSKWPVV